MTSISSHIGSSFKIGALEAPNRLVQAPMAGISTRAFRLQARRHGAGLTCTEMISSYGLHHGNRRTVEMLELTPGEMPVSVQIFGNRPEVMAEAAAASEAAGASLVDINMGCPVRKVVKTGAGAALMEDAGRAQCVVAAAAAAVTIPVTVKIRSGPRGADIAGGFAERMVAAGAAAICIHPRLGDRGRRGSADHRVTAGLVERLDVPVIASGDIDSAASAKAVMDDTGCAAVMVGRAALGNPWLFAGIIAGSGAGRRAAPQIIAELERFYRDLEAEMGEERAVRFMRKFYSWYLAPFRPDAGTRLGLRTATSFEAVRELLQSWQALSPGSRAVVE